LSIHLALYALAAGVCVWWVAAIGWEPGVEATLAAVVASDVAAIVAQQPLSTLAARLTWDGSAWHVVRPGRDACAGRVRPVLDLGRWLLVRFNPTAGEPQGARSALWLLLSRRDVAAAWPALPVALHAPPPAQPAA
jgi:hypothetical protein